MNAADGPESEAVNTMARMILTGVWVVTDISAFEPLAFILIPVPFVLAALLACYVPASRASRVHPNVALRDL